MLRMESKVSSQLVCIHGCKFVRKACFSRSCSQPALFSMDCEKCELVHCHGGYTTLKKLEVVKEQLRTVEKTVALDSKGMKQEASHWADLYRELPNGFAKEAAKLSGVDLTRCFGELASMTGQQVG